MGLVGQQLREALALERRQRAVVERRDERGALVVEPLDDRGGEVGRVLDFLADAVEVIGELLALGVGQAAAAEEAVDFRDRLRLPP